MIRPWMTILALSATLALVGCASTPVQGYSGYARPAAEVAVVEYGGNTWVFNLILYKVDGVTSEDFNTLGYGYNSRPDGNVKVHLLPGTHVLEFDLSDAKAVKTLKFTGEAGKAYTLVQDQGNLSVVTKEGGKVVPVPSELATVAWYQEPPKEAPHATLVEDGEPVFGASKEGLGIVFRIDGAPGKEWFNRYRFNDAMAGAFQLRLTPGKHTLEYYGILGDSYQTMTQTQEYTFEEGKTYTLSFVRKTVQGIDLLVDTLVEVKD